jgi:sugar phosphate isomerase/epimerase
MLAVKKPIEESFKMAILNGLDHIEIDLIQTYHNIETFNIRRINEIKRLSKKHNIPLSLHTPYTINPGDEVEFFRKVNEEYLKKCILLAHKLNCTHITTHMGFWVGLPSWKWKRKKALDILVKTIKNVVPLLKKYKVYLALENVNPMPENSEFQLLGDNIEDLEYIYSKVKSSFVRMCLDTGHANINEGPLKYIQKFGKRIISVHFHDNNKRIDEHLAVGAGNINWKKVTNEFKKMKFTGPFISEVFSQTPKEAKEDLLKFF